MTQKQFGVFCFSLLDLEVGLTLLGRVSVSVLLNPLVELTKLLVTLVLNEFILFSQSLVGVLQLFQLLAQVSFLADAIAAE